jgi:hypothetical protein
VLFMDPDNSSSGYTYHQHIAHFKNGFKFQRSE